MSQVQPNIPLNQQQLEILKLFTRELEERDMLEIKRLIVQYLAEKTTKQVDEVWDQKEWTNEKMDSILMEHNRTPYDSKN